MISRFNGSLITVSTIISLLDWHEEESFGIGAGSVEKFTFGAV